MTRSFRLLLAFCTLALAASLAPAQTACERSAGAPDWLPCGPDRVLSAEELRTWLVRPNQPTRMALTGGGSGRKFNLVMHPDSRLDMRVGNGTNFGREWKLVENKLCLRIYGGWKGEFNCGPIELKDGRAWWLDPDDNSRNPIDALAFGS